MKDIDFDAAAKYWEEELVWVAHLEANGVELYGTLKDRDNAARAGLFLDKALSKVPEPPHCLVGDYVDGLGGEEPKPCPECGGRKYVQQVGMCSEHICESWCEPSKCRWVKPCPTCQGKGVRDSIPKSNGVIEPAICPTCQGEGR